MGDLAGKPRCHRALDVWSCLRRHPPLGSRGGDCRCQYKGADLVPALFPELVVIEVVHQVFREIQNTHPYIHSAIELQTALVDLNSHQVVIKDIGPSKHRAGDEAPEFVLLVSSHQLHINPFPQVLHGLPKVVHQLVEVLLKATGCLLPELSIFSDVWLHPRALVEPEGAMDRSQTQALRHI